ncbi:hypothetical protein OESDEN_15402 [Oesophagostomum dentatum]|uniref:Uncharacterized protein n=1 Tax=Oesophagostomum dentatum TaxID=61180 RepID=A0A0B1SHR0_OESDE|nr:hypothetical protein OESDEN_15402 [Oesophagostomum dentatum]
MLLCYFWLYFPNCKTSSVDVQHNFSDPTPILEQAIIWKAQAEKTNIAVEEANQLRAQLALAQTELADLKNQDVTIRQLRDTIAKLEEEKAKEVEKAIEEVEKELRDEFSVRDNETTMRSDKLKAENAALEKKVSRLATINTLWGVYGPGLAIRARLGSIMRSASTNSTLILPAQPRIANFIRETQKDQDKCKPYSRQLFRSPCSVL